MDGYNPHERELRVLFISFIVLAALIVLITRIDSPVGFFSKTNEPIIHPTMHCCRALQSTQCYVVLWGEDCGDDLYVGDVDVDDARSCTLYPVCES